MAHTVLVVEDSDELLWSIANILDVAGFHVEAALTGHEALDIWGRCKSAELVILNYRLPDMSGLRVLQRLRERGYTASAIAISGVGDDEVKRSFLSQGECAFIEKPFDMHTLIHQCKIALQSSGIMTV